ncbi:TPA: hypothetical protein JI173_00065 [Acinetobacter baumannii]|nr:hypothetical protein [Acinetobacter baumannii]
MDKISECEVINAKIYKTILLNWVGKKELTEEDSQKIKEFVDEYADQLISMENSELLKIIFPFIFKSLDEDGHKKHLEEVFNLISEKHPLLFQGMAEYGEKPIQFSANILILSLIKLVENEIDSNNNINKILSLGLIIKVIELHKFSHSTYEYGIFIKDIILDILNDFVRANIIDQDLKEPFIKLKPTEAINKFNELKFDEDTNEPEAENYSRILHNNTIHAYNGAFNTRKNYELFKIKFLDYIKKVQIEKDLIWWLNVKHTKNYNKYDFYSYRKISDPFLCSAFMAYDLCEIVGIDKIPMDNKIFALLLESLYSCFPDILGNAKVEKSIKEIDKVEYDIIPNISNLRGLILLLENYVDFSTPLEVEIFAIQLLLLNECVEIGFV